MSLLISLLVIVAIVCVLIWLINMIPFPAELSILRFVFILIVVVAAIMKVWPMIG